MLRFAGLIRLVGELFVMNRAFSYLMLLSGAMVVTPLSEAGTFPVEEKVELDQQLGEERERKASAHAHYLLARQLEVEGRMTQAMEHYLAYLQKSGGHVFMEMLPHIASLVAVQDGFERALAVLGEEMEREPLQLQPVVVFTQLALQWVKEKPEQKGELLRVMKEGVKRFPEQAEAYHNAVIGYLALDMRGEAEDLMGRVLEREVDDARFWLQLGRTAQELWPLVNNEKREEHLAKSNVYVGRARELALREEDEAVLLEVVDYYLFTSQMKQSTEVCEALVKVSGSLESRKRLWRLYDATERRAEAFQALQDLVEFYPEDIEHRRMLALHYRSQRQWQKAAEQLEAALQAGGGNLSDYLLISNLLMLGDDEKKINGFTARGQQLFPDDPVMGFLRARALSRLRQFDEAVELYQQVAKSAETATPELLDDSFYFSWGSALERSGNFDEAARQFDKSIQLTPPDQLERAAQTMNYLGYMWLQQNRHLDRAEKLISKANELVQNEPAYIDSLGWLYYKQGKLEKALSELLRAEKLMDDVSSDDAEIFEHIALTYEKLQQAEKAQQYWRKTLELNPTDEGIQQRARKALGLEGKPKSKVVEEEEK